MIENGTVFVPKNIPEYLRQIFSMDNMLADAAKQDAERTIGYIEGVLAVIQTLEVISREDEED